MKRLTLLASLLSAMPILPSTANSTPSETQVYAGAGVSTGQVGFFYSVLRPYGEWIEIEPAFYAWRPMRVRHGWRPYFYGRWVWTDYGWYWVSDEPFGWAVFHYGRWYHDDYYGWIWMPDHIWGPAWVEWRYDDNYIGWAPLPPYASFSISVGIRFTTRWYSPTHYWSFVPYRYFTTPNILQYAVSEDHARRIIRTSRSAVRYEVDRDRIVNRGVDRNHIERRGNLRIDRVDVRETRDRDERIVRDRTRERIEVFRPSRAELEQRPERIDARPSDRRLSLELDYVERSRSSEPVHNGVNRRGGATRSDNNRDRERNVDPSPGREQMERGARPIPLEVRPETRSQERWQVRPETRRESGSTPEHRAVPERPERKDRSVEPRPAPSERSARDRRETPTVKPENRRDQPPSGRDQRQDGRRRGRDGN